MLLAAWASVLVLCSDGQAPISCFSSWKWLKISAGGRRNTKWAADTRTQPLCFSIFIQCGSGTYIIGASLSEHCVLRGGTIRKSVRAVDEKYTLLHELACNIASYCTSGRGIFTSRRRVKMQPTSAITAICTLTSVIKYLLSITTTASCLFLHEVRSNSPFERTGSN